MGLEFRLQPQQAQKLVLTQQMRQYMALLTMTSVELQQRISQELSENPALEEDEDEENAVAEDSNTEDTQPTELVEQLEQLDQLESYNSILTNDPDSQSKGLSDYNYQQSLIKQETSLLDYLTWQASLLSLGEREKRIAELIIGNISDDGYFLVDPMEIAQSEHIDVNLVTNVLKKIQSLDPAGIATRNLQECLLVQISRRKVAEDNMTAYWQIAERIVLNDFDKLMHKQISGLAKKIGVKQGSIQIAVKLITSLNPKPGHLYYPDKNSTIIPDLKFIVDDNGKVSVEVINENIPLLRLSSKYLELLKDPNVDKKTKDYLQNKIKAARDFLSSLQQRQSTIERIASIVADKQEAFFSKGFASLCPMRMKDIADELGLHESTVSRAISGKYVETPRGTIALKSFFSQALHTADGGETSQNAVIDRIKSLIDNEDSTKPLSDAKLTDLLNQEGVQVARRTVAKYREKLKVLPAHLRKISKK